MVTLSMGMLIVFVLIAIALVFFVEEAIPSSITAALIVVAVILTFGLTPRLSTRDEFVTEPSSESHDQTYD